MKSYEADIATTLKGIHHELADFKQHYLMDRGKVKQPVKLPKLEKKVKRLEHQKERAEYWWAVWFLVCRLYREHHEATTANDFVEKCAEIQRLYAEDGRSRQWNEAWGIWKEGWEDDDSQLWKEGWQDEQGRTPGEAESSE